MIAQNMISVFAGSSEPRTYDLDSFGKDILLFGRGPYHGDNPSLRNDIVVDQAATTISRAHCVFKRFGDTWVIEDSGSTNGLQLNGTIIRSRKLHDGDRIFIGTDERRGCVIAFSRVQQSRQSQDQAIETNTLSLANKQKIVLGRSPDCDVVISHPSASRHHCIIERGPNGFTITDNHSTNGVLVNGEPLDRTRQIRHMDRITIADTTLVFCDDMLYSTVHRGGMSLSANNVCKRVKTKKGSKYIADHVSLTINPGEFAAIIGGSGAGKSTLMNCLSGMTGFDSGEVLIGGEPLRQSSRSIRGTIGYVPQKDTVYDDLTLDRMLYYSAKLRMPSDTSEADIRSKIEETLRTVELENHRHTKVGRLSGGQKKRASIAIELLASPKLFFLDEPFSGLDPGTEKKLMIMLKGLAQSGRTVIMVTHSVQSIDLCDRVICMGQGGKLCFSGAPDQALKFFGERSMADVYGALDEQSGALSERFKAVSGGSAQVASTPKKAAPSAKGTRYPVHRFRQFRILTRRYTELSFNRRGRLILLLLMPVILSVFVCAAFQLDGGLKNRIYNFVNESLPFISLKSSFLTKTNFPFAVVSDTRALTLAFACAGFWTGIFNSIQEISKEDGIYCRERFTGLRVSPYVLSKLTVCGVLCIIQSALMVAVLMLFSDTIVTLNGDVNSVTAYTIKLGSSGMIFTNAMWLELYVTTLLTLLSAMCLGLAVSAAVSNDLALVLCPICLLPQILFSNVVSSLSGFTADISQIITCKWATVAYCTSMDINNMLLSLSYDSQHGRWLETELEAGIFSADYSMETSYILGLNPIASAWVYMLILAVACILIAIVLLRLKGAEGIRLRAPKPQKVSKSR